mmetsp:Transcript_232/g.277  ORF Transcript_232/g.277 Transcript_232/m.277 type:complete len:173 (+) Transcript_232:614-1132(+)|eukprot:CAMPEP_0204916764 /NCGR_PEP_ID=MMETSP1397-20131031/14507_1 /ASSEMBLY_ACC=CAM_ASM_000891 /TAXON_ID=49980 /ORGANISM="Climacostomum Climacostomum virens, Strain Stock W-24" /LENGTH=172 /DNA_ID=CAMNT_0052089389 /DNA_START=521 /DNA_END=1039 /DNA_ORIENTATION=-
MIITALHEFSHQLLRLETNSVSEYLNFGTPYKPIPRNSQSSSSAEQGALEVDSQSSDGVKKTPEPHERKTKPGNHTSSDESETVVELGQAEKELVNTKLDRVFPFMLAGHTTEEVLSGYDLEMFMFSYKVPHITQEAAQLLLNRAYWALQLKEFLDQFWKASLKGKSSLQPQ